MTGTVSGFQTFATALADADTTYYCIVDGTNDTFEVGLGTWAESSSTLTRTTILESSESDNSAVDFSGSVAKEVFITYPAEKAVFLNANDKLVVGGVEYLSATTNRWHKKIPSSGIHLMSSATGNDDNGNALSFTGDQVDVFVNGIRLSKDAGDYTLVGTNRVDFASNLYPSNDDIVEIVSYNIFSGTYGDSDVNTHLNQSSASSGQVLSWNGSDYAWIATGAGNLSNVVEDSSPQLGGNLDINGNDIVSTSNANIEILPNGTGKVHLDGDGSSGGVVISDGAIDIKTGTGNVAELKFYCESNNAHYVSLKAPAHSDFSGNVTLTLPTTDGSSGEYLKTDGSGVLSWDTPSGGGGGNTDILTFETTSSLPTSVAQDTVKLYEHASALYLRSYRGNTAHPVFVITNSAGTEVFKVFGNGDLTLTDKITAKKILCEGGSETGRIELQAPNVSDHISINAPATLSGNTDYILPEDGSSGEYLKTDGSGNLSWDTPSGGSDLVNDTSPELGGNLDVLTRDIVSSSNRDIDVKPNGSGKIKLVTTTGTTIVTTNSGGTNTTLENMNLWLNNDSTSMGSSVALALHTGTDTSSSHAYTFMRATRESNTSANFEINVQHANSGTPSYYKTTFGANTDGGKVSFPKNIEIGNADTYQSIIQSHGSISADRTFTFPDASGTIALTSTSAWEVVATIDATAGNEVSGMEFTVENDYMYQFLISVQATTNNEQLECQYAIMSGGSVNYTAFNTYFTNFQFPSSGGITSTNTGSGSNTGPTLSLNGVLKNSASNASNMGTPCTGILNWHQTNQRSDGGYSYTLQRNGTGWFDYMNGTDGLRGFTMHRNITTNEIVRIKFKMNAGNMLGTIRQLRSPM